MLFLSNTTKEKPREKAGKATDPPSARRLYFLIYQLKTITISPRTVDPGNSTEYNQVEPAFQYNCNDLIKVSINFLLYMT